MHGKWSKGVALVIGNFELTLPSGLILILNNCYYVPTMSSNIISVSCLDKDGFRFIIENNTISIYRRDIFYGIAHLMNGLYVLNFDESDYKSIYNINTKRFKSNNLNSTYFWHCRLGHINERRISKIHLILNHMNHVNLF